MIKTLIAGEQLTAALEKQQAYFDEHVIDELAEWKQARALETHALLQENAQLKRRLRMAKADLRSDPS